MSEVKTTNSGGGASVTVNAPAADVAAAAAAAATAKMPEGGAEKFWNAKEGVYNWEAHAKEQAWQLASLKTGKPADKVTAPAGTTPPAGDAEAIAAGAGVDLDAVNRAIVAGEEIPADARAKLNAIGITDETIDAVIASQRMVVEQHFNEVTSFVGGKDGLARLSDFVAKNFRAEEIAAFNEQLNDPDRWKATAVYLLHQAGLPQGNKGSIMQGPNAAGPATPATGSYQTDAELQADIRKPEYRRDPNFRAQVEQRLRNSPHLMGQGNPRLHTP